VASPLIDEGLRRRPFGQSGFITPKEILKCKITFGPLLRVSLRFL